MIIIILILEMQRHAMSAVVDSKEGWVVGQRTRPFLWTLGTLRSGEGEGPATGDPGILLPAPDLVAWCLVAPPPGAEWCVATCRMGCSMKGLPSRLQACGGTGSGPNRGQWMPFCGRTHSGGQENFCLSACLSLSLSLSLSLGCFHCETGPNKC